MTNSSQHPGSTGQHPGGTGQHSDNRKESKKAIDSTLVRLIATSRTPVSRIDLARKTGLSKMTISNHVAELIRKGIVVERDSQGQAENVLGRHPIPLHISGLSPCICGLWITRTHTQAVLADISGSIIDMSKMYYQGSLSREALISMLLSQYDALASRTGRRIIGCGISSIGPLDSTTGYLLNPSNFWGLSYIPLTEIVSAHTGLPTYLIHDAHAGALVEKIYGRGGPYENFVYLHISEGIGLGFVLNGALFNGFSGQSGEIGHTSINFNGPRCSCGNRGCLESYASIDRMRKKISELLPLFPDSAFKKLKSPSRSDVINFASGGDPIAVAALDEFCGYLAHALANLLRLLDFSTIIVGYDALSSSYILEKILYEKMRDYSPPEKNNVEILHSYFNNDGPLMGAIAIVANEVFHQNISL